MPDLKEEKGRWVGSDALPRCPLRTEWHAAQLSGCCWQGPRLFIPVAIVSGQKILVIQYHVPFLGERSIQYAVHMWSKAWISHPLSVLFWRAILVLDLYEASTFFFLQFHLLLLSACVPGLSATVGPWDIRGELSGVSPLIPLWLSDTKFMLSVLSNKCSYLVCHVSGFYWSLSGFQSLAWFSSFFSTCPQVSKTPLYFPTVFYPFSGLLHWKPNW